MDFQLCAQAQGCGTVKQHPYFYHPPHGIWVHSVTDLVVRLRKAQFKQGAIKDRVIEVANPKWGWTNESLSLIGLIDLHVAKDLEDA